MSRVSQYVNQIINNPVILGPDEYDEVGEVEYPEDEFADEEFDEEDWEDAAWEDYVDRALRIDHYI